MTRPDLLTIAARLIGMGIFAVVGLGVARAGPFDPPKPQTLARAEDRERARMLGEPCTEADVGHGCWRYNGGLFRAAPCRYRIDATSVGSLPTDQCYKMDGPRRFRGVWIDAFEGQTFIPEGTAPPAWPHGDPKSRDWRHKADRAQAASIWLDVERVHLPHDWSKSSRRMMMEFIGRKTKYLGAHGHMGMSGSEIIVDRVIYLSKME